MYCMLCLLAVHLSEIKKLLECKNIKKNIFSFNKVLIKEGVSCRTGQEIPRKGQFSPDGNGFK